MEHDGPTTETQLTSEVAALRTDSSSKQSAKKGVATPLSMAKELFMRSLVPRPMRESPVVPDVDKTPGEFEHETTSSFANLEKVAGDDSIDLWTDLVGTKLRSERTPFRPLHKTGVIHVMQQARQLGYSPEEPDWANLGQGAPECGELPHQPTRETSMVLNDAVLNEYAPVEGHRDLRQAIATYYNEFFRKNEKSQYTYKNVCVTSGGRSGLCRIMACLNRINVGYCVPDYTAYEELLASWSRIQAIPILHDEFNKHPSTSDLRRSIEGHGLGAVLVSNPGNPTGSIIPDSELTTWCEMAREFSCMMIMDEFYSHYVYDEEEIFSSARFVEDVNKDPVLIVNGLTKNWRCPGWRVCWVVGPESFIEALGSAGSFLDGGANHPLQKQAVKLMDIDFVREDSLVLRTYFQQKRDYMVGRLLEMGFQIEHKPKATFYVWANVVTLPKPAQRLRDSVSFCAAALHAKVICVPGIFFDINPVQRRHVAKNGFINYVRFSFGPPLKDLETGLDNIERMLANPPDRATLRGYVEVFVSAQQEL
eukprot:m.13483 g.13483  ORF g.13483 m.13483 type:complete len:536 (+) comp3306_c0_seq1:95-1702(+)